MGNIKVNKSDVGHCCWCGAPTLMEKTMTADTPILEEMEDKIDMIGRNQVWGTNSDWSRLNMNSDTEAELLVYDQLLSTVSFKTVCEKCLIDDEKLYRKYYEK